MLAYITGDIKASSSLTRKNDKENEKSTITLPESGDDGEGFFSRFLDKINPLDDK